MVGRPAPAHLQLGRRLLAGLHVEALRALGRRAEVGDLLLDAAEPDLVLRRQLEVQRGAGAVGCAIADAVFGGVALKAEAVQAGWFIVTNFHGSSLAAGRAVHGVPAAGAGAEAARRVLGALPRGRPLVVLEPGGGRAEAGFGLVGNESTCRVGGW